MAPQSPAPKHHIQLQVQPLTTHWHNRSLSSLSATSETATFHSAHAHLQNMELRQLTFTSPSATQLPVFSSLSPKHSNSPTPLPSPKLESAPVRMDRQDSGYAETSPYPAAPGSRGTSTSSADGRRSPNSAVRPKRRTTDSSTTSSTRHQKKRASRSSNTRTSNSGSRPRFSSSHTSPYPTQQPYQFFQFPSLSDPSPPAPEVTAPVPAPPATVQYWTSDSTRRLEYAAIDAASQGVRGFLIKMVPDCILPEASRRPRFCEDDGDSDAGSVRRYRLAMPDESEKERAGVKGATGREGKKARPRAALLRRWTTFGGWSASMSGRR
ncbi:uncharacterized protein L3040_003511 [Drepanopeziza brunnea f. sp. 'multigermtubi']|uniref:Uncharacterized protein n=1 Tax=Marssonina brunnea f. sp. multigermtubi (strain MB_m1) TaxID=1072389 RepID=K1WUE6_MARBU|nr:uncharacterized protein MBM_06083 [Drepanopeziza brunnea f. sp. 'multigermtubi' MB_m1]EKD16072.1 hypothetical protein MBM_06083 [Drepanopeziza brunnea f. sp. 'multigermtubi' MB_m1]KAJ5047692.1 hypothetical protein L3040_003511 [Drepanopeziza brunnea f. sp. 'multigermtubi']